MNGRFATKLALQLTETRPIYSRIGEWGLVAASLPDPAWENTAGQRIGPAERVGAGRKI